MNYPQIVKCAGERHQSQLIFLIGNLSNYNHGIYREFNSTAAQSCFVYILTVATWRTSSFRSFFPFLLPTCIVSSKRLVLYFQISQREPF